MARLEFLKRKPPQPLDFKQGSANVIRYFRRREMIRLNQDQVKREDWSGLDREQKMILYAKISDILQIPEFVSSYEPNENFSLITVTYAAGFKEVLLPGRFFGERRNLIKICEELFPVKQEYDGIVFASHFDLAWYVEKRISALRVDERYYEILQILDIKPTLLLDIKPTLIPDKTPPLIPDETPTLLLDKTPTSPKITQS